MEVDILPKYGLSRHCLGIGKFNRKFYSNGHVVLCDAFAKRAICDDKVELAPLPEICIKCFDFPYCGGIKPCKEPNCTGNYSDKEIVRKRILCYVENFLLNE